MDSLRIQLLGRFSLSVDGIPLAALNTPRLQSLIAYLILNRSAPVIRYHLAFQFWPGSSESQARTNLRNLVHLLRQALPNSDLFIQSDAQTLQWRQDLPFWLDVLEFERLLAVTPGDRLHRENLEQAVQLYQGDLLPSCYDDWIIPERDRLHRAFEALLEALAEVTEGMRDYPAALEYTRRWLQVDPLQTTANRQLIRLHTLLDNRPAAMKAYQDYASLLKRELHIQPDQETQDVYTHLLQQNGDDNLITPRAARASLVGRQNEWNELQVIWRSAAAGNPQAVFLTGEAGIGKTRLVEELVQWARRQGIRTAIANCYPAEGSLPYTPVVSWLRSRPLPHLDNVWLVELARLLPEVLHRYPKLPQPEPLQEAWQRQRLFEALARAILGDRRKLLLVLEDIHWCDQDTLEWLHFLLRFDDKAPVLIVATERSEETTPLEYQIKLLKSSLAGANRYNEVRLRPLNETDSFRLAAEITEEGTNQVLAPDRAAHIFHETEGNPLFVVEMVRLGFTPQPPGQQPFEPAVLSNKARTILEWRINQLTPQTRELASLAATIGREFYLDVLLQSSGLAEEMLVKALNELLQRKIVLEQSPDRYDFTHDKLRQAVFTGMSTAHRRLLHRQVAEAYVAMAGEAPQSRSAEIAYHYEEAGLALPAIQYYRMASETAARIFSNADAIRWLQHAIVLAEGLRPDSEKSRIFSQDLAMLYEALGDVLALTGDYPQALEEFLKALDQHFAQARTWKSALYRKISNVQVSLYLYEDAEASLDSSEQVLALNHDSVLEDRQAWIDVQLARGQIYYWRNKWREIDLLVQKVQLEIDAYGDDLQRIELLTSIFQYYCRAERYHLSQATVEIAQRKRQLYAASGALYKTVHSDFELGFAFLWHGAPKQAQEVLSSAHKAAEAIGARTLQVRCLSYLSVATRQLRQVEAVREQAERLFGLSTSIGQHVYIGVAWANRAWLAWLAGNEQAVLSCAQSALASWKNHPLVFPFRGLAMWPLLATAVKHRNLNEAIELSQDLLDPGQRLLTDSLSQSLEKAILTYQAGDSQKAALLFDMVLKEAQETGEL